jgi:hypothetical protein
MSMSSTPPAVTPALPPAVKYKNGQVEHLVFTELDVFELYQFIDLLVAGRTPEIVQLCARRQAEWVKSLDFPTYLALAKYFINANFQKAVEIATSDPIAGLKVGPLLMQMGAMLQKIPAVTMPPESSAEISPTSAATLTPAAPSGSSSSTAPAPTAAAAPTGAAS